MQGGCGSTPLSTPHHTTTRGISVAQNASCVSAPPATHKTQEAFSSDAREPRHPPSFFTRPAIHNAYGTTPSAAAPGGDDGAIDELMLFGQPTRTRNDGKKTKREAEGRREEKRREEARRVPLFVHRSTTLRPSGPCRASGAEGVVGLWYN